MVSTVYREAAMAGSGGGGDGEHYSRLIRELCALLVAVIDTSPSAAAAPSSQRRATGPGSPGVSPAAAASMLLGASMALMLCGSVTFAIGFLLMPWVAGVALLFGLAAAVSALSAGVFGKSAAAARGRASSPPATYASDKPLVA
ncbi:uncharacterized protein LOC102707633 [Oryza brachyantha]|uniref:uncharacterized protein LOC102707633 n=1 Tax=Oryza brachyantha TaxID=4533 RepID=UPI001AD99FB2|nr:uncharacterized protein LOC102707633 [Oryza brachyantha]